MSKILIVEDEESIADLEKDYLELSGFEVEIENQGDTGLVRTAVRLDHHIVNELPADFIDADGVRLFMLHINDIRMILALCLFTGRAFHTGLDPVLLALKRHRKQ